jgi:hypothetical protein
LGEVAYDIGVQLGRGHTNQVAPDLDLQVRRTLLRQLRRDENRIYEISLEMTELVNEAWGRFRRSYE